MSVLLTSPALVLLLPADAALSAATGWSPAPALAVLLVSLANLMHFSQGWVQFGYRFSNDDVPFALVLVALGFARLVACRPPTLGDAARHVGLVVLSVAVNAWGVAWGRILGW